MGRHHRKARQPRCTRRSAVAVIAAELPEDYRQASRLAAGGQYDEARRLYGKLSVATSNTRPRALIGNDLAALDAVNGDLSEARQGLQAALAIDEACLPARRNLELLVSRLGMDHEHTAEIAANAARPEPRPPINTESRALKSIGADLNELAVSVFGDAREPAIVPADSAAPIRVAILSFLFNWPSSGGGNIHTVELATFLGRAGYEIRHFHASYPEWGIGRVTDDLPFQSQALEFDTPSWSLDEIKSRYRQAVQSVDPDYVVITDAWNIKPILAEAVEGYPYYLRFQALECLCPLNNLRLLARSPEIVEQCSRNQLANPGVCRRCLAERGHQSGLLHQLERELCRVGTTEYDRQLRTALEGAEAVLALNPLIASLVEPFVQRVRVVPWGMDSSRFPRPLDEAMRGECASLGEALVSPFAPRKDALMGDVLSQERKATMRPGDFSLEAATVISLFMAAVQGEFIKGYHVAHEACRLLRRTRSDFELIVTFDPPGRIDEFTRSVGWCSQAELPRHYRAADICLVPTIAQDGLSRTSVEAMASSIPVIASRIGGLPFTVDDGVTGSLFEPGNAADLACQITKLLNDPDLRRRMGLAGRQRFEEEFQWETVVERYYRPLFTRRRVGSRQ